MNRFITVTSRAGLIIAIALSVLLQNTCSIQANEESLDGHFDGESMFSEVYTIFLGLDNPVFSIESSTDGSKSIKNQYGDVQPEVIIEPIDQANSEKLIKITIDSDSLQNSRVEINFPAAVLTIADEINETYLNENSKSLPSHIPNLIDKDKRLSIISSSKEEQATTDVNDDLSSSVSSTLTEEQATTDVIATTDVNDDLSSSVSSTLTEEQAKTDVNDDLSSSVSSTLTEEQATTDVNDDLSSSVSSTE